MVLSYIIPNRGQKYEYKSENTDIKRINEEERN